MKLNWGEIVSLHLSVNQKKIDQLYSQQNGWIHDVHVSANPMQLRNIVHMLEQV